MVISLILSSSILINRNEILFFHHLIVLKLLIFTKITQFSHNTSKNNPFTLSKLFFFSKHLNTMKFNIKLWQAKKYVGEIMYEEEIYTETVEDKQETLPFVEGEYVEENNHGEWYSYLRISLSELEHDDQYTGKPLLLPVEKVQYDDEEPRYRSRLLIIDDENEEYLQININLKSNSDVQTNIHNASSLYALIAGIENLHNPEWSTIYNRIKTVNLEDWENYINSKESMTVKTVAKEGKGFTYNTFRILELI